MKKIYITPKLNLTQIASETLIAVSFDKNATGADQDVVLVKEDNAARSNYNVWDDDWSK